MAASAAGAGQGPCARCAATDDVFGVYAVINGSIFEGDGVPATSANDVAATIVSEPAKPAGPLGTLRGYGIAGLDTDDMPVSFDAQSPWNTWVSSHDLNLIDVGVPAGNRGTFSTYSTGIDYALGGSAALGVVTRAREGTVVSDPQGAALASKFTGGGAYITSKLYGGTELLGSMIYEHGDNAITFQDAHGSFETGTWSSEARVAKRLGLGSGWVEPSVDMRYATVDRAAYIDSTGADLAASRAETGVVTYGPKVGRDFHALDSTFKPYAKIGGYMNFAPADPVETAVLPAYAVTGTGIDAGAGLEVNFLGGMVLTAAGDVYGLQDTTEAWSMTGGLGMPFATIGLEDFDPKGQLRLDLSRNQDDALAKASVTMSLN